MKNARATVDHYFNTPGVTWCKPIQRKDSPGLRPGRWRIRLWTGKHTCINLGYAETRREAVKKLEQAKKERANGADG